MRVEATTVDLGIGRFVGSPVPGEIVRAIVPPALPPEPAIDILSSLPLVSAVGRWMELHCFCRGRKLFLCTYILKEIVFLPDRRDALFQTEAEGGQPTIDDIREVANYVAAMMYEL